MARVVWACRGIPRGQKARRRSDRASRPRATTHRALFVRARTTRPCFIAAFFCLGRRGNGEIGSVDTPALQDPEVRAVSEDRCSCAASRSVVAVARLPAASFAGSLVGAVGLVRCWRKGHFSRLGSTVSASCDRNDRLVTNDRTSGDRHAPRAGDRVPLIRRLLHELVEAQRRFPKFVCSILLRACEGATESLLITG